MRGERLACCEVLKQRPFVLSPKRKRGSNVWFNGTYMVSCIPFRYKLDFYDLTEFQTALETLDARRFEQKAGQETA